MPSGVYERSEEYKQYIGDFWQDKHQDPETIAKRNASHAARPRASCLGCKRLFKIGRAFDRHRESCNFPPPCAYLTCDKPRDFKNRHKLCVMHQTISDRCRMFGISVERYFEMWHECSGACSGCRKLLKMHGTGASKESVVHIDHDADTGRVRGFLCFQCNIGIGYLQHDVETMQRLVSYLENTK